MSLHSTARAFLAIGGRIMLNPEGRLESAISMDRLFERTWPNPEPAEAFEARRRVHRRYDRVERRHPAELRQIVQERGEPVNGWLVWQQETG